MSSPTREERLEYVVRQLRVLAARRRLPVTISAIRSAVLVKRRGGNTRPRATQRLGAAIERIRGAIRPRRIRERIPAAAEAIRRAFEAQAPAVREKWLPFMAGFGGNGLPVPVLSVCGHGTAEVRFTQLLRYYLDPKDKHGLGARALRVLFGTLPGLEGVDWAGAVVDAEVDLGVIVLPDGTLKGSTLDLLVRLPGHSILIEQKVGAQEGRDVAGDSIVTQLARYSQAFEQRFADVPGPRTRIFLSPTGRTTDTPGWLVASHRAWIAALATLLEEDQLTGTARYNLVALLWELLIGPLSGGDVLPRLAEIGAELLVDAPRAAALHRSATRLFPDTDLLLQIVGGLQ